MNLSENSGTLENPAVYDDVKTNIEIGPTSPEDELWTTPQVARYLHVSLKTVFNLRKNGLPYVQLGGAVRFVPQEIKDFLIKSRGLSSHRLRQIARKGTVG
jgi:excisionase family DNA binding protein